MEARINNLAKDESYLVDEFRILTEDICAMLAMGGLNRKPYKPGLPYFSKLSPERKDHVFQNLNFYRTLCSEQINEGYKIQDSKSFTWRALNKLYLVPPSDMFDKMMDEDIVEIYSSENIQLFRNFRFFEFCSYSLEELCCVEWWYLFDRDQTQGTKMITEIQKLLTGEIRGGFAPDVRPHVMNESQSEEKLSMNYEMRWIAPLMKNKSIAGYVVLEQATLLKN